MISHKSKCESEDGSYGSWKTWKVLAPVDQRLDNAIHRINHYPVDSVICFVNTYPMDNDLSPAVDSVTHFENNPGQTAVLLWCFPGLESPGERLLVLEILQPSQILRTYKTYKKCMADTNEILEVKGFM